MMKSGRGLNVSKERLQHIKELRRARRVHGGLNRAICSGNEAKKRHWQGIVLKHINEE